MKSLLIGLVILMGVSFSAQAEITYDREYAYLALLDMGYYVSPEQVGEMFKDNVFILVNTDVCYSLGAVHFDDSQRSCLLQVQPDGTVWGWDPGPNGSLY